MKQYLGIVIMMGAATAIGGLLVHAEDQRLEKVYDLPGAYDWVVPSGVSEVEITMVGGGGAGGRGGHYEIWSAPQRRVLYVQAYHKHNSRENTDFNWSDPTRIKGPARVKMTGGACGNSQWDHLGSQRFHNWPEGNRYHHLPQGTEEWRSGEERIFGVSVGGPGFRWDGCDQNLDVEYLDEFTALGLNGASGTVIRSQVILNLQAGDVLTFSVGAGGRDGHGGDTRVIRRGAAGQLMPISLKDGAVVETLLAAGGERGHDGREKVRMISELEPIPAIPGAGGHGAQRLGIDGGEGQPGRVKLTYVQEVIDREQVQRAQWQAYVLTRLISEYTRELAIGVQHANAAMEVCIQMACQQDSDLHQALQEIESLRNNAQSSNARLNQAVAHFENLLFSSLSRSPELFQPLLTEGLPAQLTDL